MLEAIDIVNQYLWDLLIVLLLGSGLYYSFRTRFIQLRRFPRIIGSLVANLKSDGNGVSSFQACCTSLAGQVGTGNLAGVALAISMGGPGAVFWMWLVAFVGMGTSCVETTLAQLFKSREPNGAFRGGPAYYMERGLGKRWMGILFSALLLICYGFVFNAVQSDSIANALNDAFEIDDRLTGVALVVLTALVIFGGIKRIARVAELIVPFMAISYIVLALVVVAINITRIPNVIGLVISSALGFREAASGAIAYSLTRALANGTRRGLFSNEAGLGSAPNAAAVAEVKHPVEQGFIQMFGVLTDTIIICTATAFIVILSGKYAQNWHERGIMLTQEALRTQIGHWGPTFIAVALLFFAFTSIIANYYYGENSLCFIAGSNRYLLNVYRIVVLGVVFMGTVGKSTLVWSCADLSMGLMATVNLTALIMLSKVAFRLIDDYERKIGDAKTPTLVGDDLPGNRWLREHGVWK